MITGITWQQFVAHYYDQAARNASYDFDSIKKASSYWDDRIDKEDVVQEAAITSLESTFKKYDPGRGATPGTLLRNIVRNEVVNEIKRASRALGVKGELTEQQEKEYTFRQMVEQIPDEAMENLKERLRSAILQLSQIDQCILGFFLENPHTFVEESVKALNVTANFVSVHKNRALAKLPSLMGVTKSDYFDMYEHRTMDYCQTVHGSLWQALQDIEAKRSNTNPVYPEFDLAGTVSRLYDALRAVMD